MDWLKTIADVLQDVELRLSDPELNTETLAEARYISATHLQRAFSILTQISLSEYIRNRRLTLAATALMEGQSVLDTALQYGYETPEAFTKAFKRFHGTLPSAVKSKNVQLIAYPPIAVQLTLKGEAPMNYTLVEKPPFSLIGISIEVPTDDSQNQMMIPKFWTEVNTNGTCDRIVSLPKMQNLVGACIMDDPTAKQFTYAIAGQFEAGAPSEGFHRWEVDAHTWAVFECIGPMPTAIQTLFKRIFSEWFPATGFEHAKGPELEVYLPGNPSDDNYRCEVWIPVVKK